MWCIGYVSTINDRKTEQKEINSILKLAIERNVPNDITGMMCYHDGVFLQFLEGDRTKIELLFNKIKSDPRHKEITVIFNDEIQERIFKSWSAGFYSIDNFAPDLKNACINLMELNVNPKSAEVGHKRIVTQFVSAFKMSKPSGASQWMLQA